MDRKEEAADLVTLTEKILHQSRQEMAASTGAIQVKSVRRIHYVSQNYDQKDLATSCLWVMREERTQWLVPAS